MNFKYQHEMKSAGLEDCPPTDYTASSMSAFRFVFSDAHHPNNFKPIGLIYPQRLNDFKENMQKCQAFGLSMFAEAREAQQHFKYLQMKTAGKFANMAGNCLATLKLETTDGIHSDPAERRDSHFTFHEFENADLNNRIVNLENL